MYIQGGTCFSTIVGWDPIEYCPAWGMPSENLYKGLQLKPQFTRSRYAIYGVCVCIHTIPSVVTGVRPVVQRTMCDVPLLI